MPEVIIHDDENFESDLRKHRHFEKPSEKRKRKMSAAVRKTRRGPRVSRV